MHFLTSLDLLQEWSNDLWHVQVKDMPLHHVKATAGGSWYECKEFTSGKYFSFETHKKPSEIISNLWKQDRELHTYVFCSSWICLWVVSLPTLTIQWFCRIYFQTWADWVATHETDSLFLPPAFSCTGRRVEQEPPGISRPAKRTRMH